MKKESFFKAAIVNAAVFVLFPFFAHAATPTLSLSYTGSGDAVQVNVTGDANSGVILNYLSTSGSVLSSAIGATNSGGSFSATVNSASYSISPNSIVNVSVASQRSASVVWPYSGTSTTATTSATLTLSQSSVSLSPGQSATVSVNNATAGSLYVASNSSPATANISISGTQISISALTAGSANVSVCSIAIASNCATLSIAVQSNSSLLFSQTNPVITVGQTASISIAGGTGTYALTSNSNPSVIQAAIAGSSINLYAAASAGSATITVCASNGSACGIITASATSTSALSALTFSQTSPSLSVGQTVSVSVGGGSGTYYVSSHSAPSTINANVVGSTLTLYAAKTGAATITLCSSGAPSQCGVIVATVTATGGSLILSQASATIAVGEKASITVSGGTAPYSILSKTGDAISATIIGSTLSVTGASVGSAGVSVCSNGGSCAFFSATVIASSGTSAPLLSPASVSLVAGQNTSVAITGSGSYYVNTNTYPTVASSYISGSILTVSALSPGATTLSVCQSASQCAPLTVSVSSAQAQSASVLTASHVLTVGQTATLSLSGGSGTYSLAGTGGGIFSATLQGAGLLVLKGISSGLGSVDVCAGSSCVSVHVIVIDTLTPAPAQGGKFRFLKPLALGDSGEDVRELQKRLKEEGYYAGPVNGSFGSLTKAAVSKYQTANGLSPLGSVGPGTRAMLNK